MSKIIQVPNTANLGQAKPVQLTAEDYAAFLAFKAQQAAKAANDQRFSIVEWIPKDRKTKELQPDRAQRMVQVRYHKPGGDPDGLDKGKYLPAECALVIAEHAEEFAALILSDEFQALLEARSKAVASGKHVD